MGLPLLESCLELYLTISGFAFAVLGTLVGLPLLESCLELLTISGFTFAGVMLGTLNHQWFAFAGVMLGTLNHQWVCLCWSAWNSQPSVFTFAGVMLGTLNHQWVYLCWSDAWNS